MDSEPRSRKLHITWVTAGQRRVITRALHDAGFTHRYIAELLKVSPATVSKDVNA